jgi:hypothetical protein
MLPARLDLVFLAAVEPALAFTVAPAHHAARRRALACHWTLDRDARRLVSRWRPRRAETAVSPARSAPATA